MEKSITVVIQHFVRFAEFSLQLQLERKINKKCCNTIRYFQGPQGAPGEKGALGAKGEKGECAPLLNLTTVSIIIY